MTMHSMDTMQEQLRPKRASNQLIKYLLGLMAVLGWVLSLIIINGSPSRSVYKTQLSPEISYNYTRNTVWFHSEGKIRELRSILSQHDIHELNEISKIKALIESMLVRRTEVYTQELNRLDAPINHIGNYYLSVFNFEDFLQEVIAESLDQNKSLDSKMIGVYEIMFVYQTEASRLLKLELSKLNN